MKKDFALTVQMDIYTIFMTKEKKKNLPLVTTDGKAEWKISNKKLSRGGTVGVGCFRASFVIRDEDDSLLTVSI
jgi:hypothetical protein